MSLWGVLPFPYRWLLLAALSAALASFGWVKGAQHGERKMDTYIAAQDKQALAAEKKIRDIEHAQQEKKDAALDNARRRADALRGVLAVADRERAGLRGDLAAARGQLAGASCDAVRKRTAALTDVFEQCVEQYSAVARQADGHATDSLTLQQAWPAKP